MQIYRIRTTVSVQRSRSNAAECKHCVSVQRQSCRVQKSTGEVPNEVHRKLVRYDLSGHPSPVPGPMTLVRLQTNDHLTAEKSSKCFGLQTLRLCTEKSSYNKDIKGGFPRRSLRPHRLQPFSVRLPVLSQPVPE